MKSGNWLKFINGDESSFTEIYSHYYDELFYYGQKLGFNEDTCKDSIQDVFYNLYVSKGKLKHIINIEFYLIRSMRNRLMDIYNNEKNTTEINYSEIIIDNSSSVVESIISNEENIQLKNEVDLRLNTLSPKQKKIVYYYFQLNLKYTEIASILNMSPDSIKKSLYRSLQKMKDLRLNSTLEFIIILIFTLIG